MATLNIGGQRVKVDDAFLSLPPEQQQATVDEIASQLGSSPSAPKQPDMYASGNVKKLTGGPGVVQDPSMVDAATTWLENAVGDIPVIGQPLQRAGDTISTHLQGAFTGQDPAELQRGLDRRRRARKNTLPLTAASGSITGNVAAFAGMGATKLGQEALGLGQKLVPTILKGAMSQQAIDTADALTEGKTGMDAINPMAAVWGAGGNVAGKAVEKVGEGIASALTSAAQRRATDAAVRGTPDVADLKAAASSLFETAKGTGTGVQSGAFNQMAMNLVRKAKGADIDPDLDGEAWTLFQRMTRYAQQGEQAGGISFGQLHNLRQMAQDVALEAKKGRTKEFGRQIVEALDDLIENMNPSMGWVPAGRIGSATSPNVSGDALLEGISLWSKAKKLSIIEEAIIKAGYQKSGLENGLRLQFQAILRNPKLRKLFTRAELREIQAVANGTTLSNITTTLGKFGLGENRIMGPAIGAALFGVPGMLAATGARKLSETMATKGAQRAANVVASRVPLPEVDPFPNMLKGPARATAYLTRGAGI